MSDDTSTVSALFTNIGSWLREQFKDDHSYDRAERDSITTTIEAPGHRLIWREYINAHGIPVLKLTDNHTIIAHQEVDAWSAVDTNFIRGQVRIIKERIEKGKYEMPKPRILPFEPDADEDEVEERTMNDLIADMLESHSEVLAATQAQLNLIAELVTRCGNNDEEE